MREWWKVMDKKVKSKKLGNLVINGFDVHFRKGTMLKDPIITAYVILKNSHMLTDRALGHPTFRDGDIVGVDTGHSFNDGQTEAQKVFSAHSQIQSVIESYKELIKDEE